MPTGIYKRTEETKEKISKTAKKNGVGKWMLGRKLSKETRKKMSENNKGENNPHYGKKPSEESRKKMSEAQKGKKNHNFGKHFSEEIKRKMSESNKGKYPSEETRMKMSKAKKGKHVSIKTEFKKGHKKQNTTKETKEKMRISAFEYAKKVVGIICPRIGKNEKQILDKLEKEIGYEILRQYKVCGYFVDGYILELRLVIEVDERPKNLERDIERQKIIEEELNCKFIRINDFD